MRPRRPFAALLPLLLLLFSLMSPPFASPAPIPFTYANPLPAANELHGVAYGNGLLVAVGEAGTILTSTDGVNWTRQESGVRYQMVDVAFGNGRFVVASHDGHYLTSTDGVHWKKSEEHCYCWGLAYGNGLFLSLEYDEKIWASTDGLTWELRKEGPLYDIYLAAVYAEDRWVATGDRESMAVSHDGFTWTEVPGGHAYGMSGVAHGNGRFVAVGTAELRWSDDGNSWTVLAPGRYTRLKEITYGGGRFVAVGWFGRVITSPDGEVWTEVQTDTRYDLNDVVYTGTQYVAVGEGGTILTSPDAASWTIRTGNMRHLQGVTYGDGLYVAVGEGGLILTSPDGTTWTRRPSGTDRYLWQVAYGGGRFVAVGSGGTIVTSADGLTWSPVPSTTLFKLRGVAYGAGRFVVVGEPPRPNDNDTGDSGCRFSSRSGESTGGLILTSVDGLSWTALQTTVGPPCLAQFDRGFFTVTDKAWRSIYSTDGLTWSDKSPVERFLIHDPRLQLDAEALDALHRRGRTGFTYEKDGHPRAPEPGVRRYGGGWFVTGSDEGDLYTLEPDGVWHSFQTASNRVNDITYGNGRFVAVGRYGMILTTAQRCYGPPFATPDATVFVVGCTQYQVNGQTKELDAPPFILNGSTYVPLRFLADALSIPHSSIRWDEASRSVTLKKGTTTVSLTVDRPVVLVNGQERSVPVAPLIVPPGRVVLPARAVAEAFGYEIQWEPDLQAVLLGEADREPTWPAGSTLRVINEGEGEATLLWSPAVDNVGVTAYRIYAGDRLVATVPGRPTRYRVTSLAPGTEHRFRVEAGDVAGNWSTGGPTASIQTSADVDRPHLVKAVADGNRLTLTFSEPLDPSHKPDGAFDVLQEGERLSAGSLHIEATTVRLWLWETVLPGKRVSLTYKPKEHQSMRDPEGNRVAPFAGFAVENESTAPRPVSAEVKADRLHLTFTEPVDTKSAQPGTEHWTVRVNGAVWELWSIWTREGTVTISLKPVPSGAKVTVSYHPKDEPDEILTDERLTPALPFTDLPVTNLSP